MLAEAAVNKAAENGLGKILHDNERAAVRTLRLAGVDISKACQNGCTPLFIILTCSGHLDIVRVLLKAGADADQADHGGRTPLHIAAEYGDKAIVKRLITARAAVKKS